MQQDQQTLSTTLDHVCRELSLLTMPSETNTNAYKRPHKPEWNIVADKHRPWWPGQPSLERRSWQYAEFKIMRQHLPPGRQQQPILAWSVQGHTDMV